MTTELRLRRGTTAQHASFVGAAGEVTVDTTQNSLVVHNGVTPGGVPQVATGLAAFRNRIINGDMRIDQRYAGTAVTPTTTQYLVDRFIATLTAASKLTFQQVTDAPPGFTNSMKITVASQFSPGAADTFLFRQVIEGTNAADLQFGTATAGVLKVGLWIKGSVAGTYSVSLRNAIGNRSYIGTVTVTNSWARQSITLTGDTTGTWANDNTAGLNLSVSLGGGSTFQGTAGSWQANNITTTAGSVTFVNQTAGSTLNITGVSLEPGSVLTTFEQRPYGVELAMCQRYFESLQMAPGQVAASGFCTGATNANVAFPLTPKRAAATVTYSGTLAVLVNGSAFNITSLGGTYSAAGNASAIQQFATASGLTTNAGANIYANGTACAVNFSAEL